MIKIERFIRVYKKNGNVDVIVMKHKLENKWSFINMTKGHICPCKFNSYNEAICDLDKCKRDGKIIDYDFIGGNDNESC